MKFLNIKMKFKHVLILFTLLVCTNFYAHKMFDDKSSSKSDNQEELLQLQENNEKLLHLENQRFLKEQQKKQMGDPSSWGTTGLQDLMMSENRQWYNPNTNQQDSGEEKFDASDIHKTDPVGPLVIIIIAIALIIFSFKTLFK